MEKTLLCVVFCIKTHALPMLEVCSLRVSCTVPVYVVLVGSYPYTTMDEPEYTGHHEYKIDIK